MATIKLKEVLKSLPIDASLSGGEKIVINDDGENKYIPYSAIKQGLVTDKERTTLTNTADWLIGHNNLTSIDAMNTELDAFNGDTAQGLHRLRCWGIPFLVTFSVLNVSDKVYMQVIQGSLTFSSDKTKIASINTASNYTIAVRYYANSKWTEWKTPIPSLQSGVKGMSNNYIYSNSGDNTHAALSGTFKVFQNSGKCYVRHKFWGSTNDYTDGQYTTCEFPAVNTSSNGCMEAAMLVRLRNTTIKEGTSTKDSVVVSYPNYADGSTKTLTLTKATTAKAGMMTADDKALLDGLRQLQLTTPPVAQTTPEGTASGYIYSSGNTDSYGVLSGAIKFYNGPAGPLFMQTVLWGGASDFSDKYKKTLQLPRATETTDGVMSFEDKKLLNQIKTKLGL